MKPTLAGAAMCALMLSACTQTTTGNGQLTALNGYAAERVAFDIREEFLADSAMATVKMKNGELFQGKLVIEKAVSDNLGVGLNWDIDKKKFGDLALFQNAKSESSSIPRGILMSHARSMECRLTLASPGSGFSGGGVGSCRLSTGETLPIQF